MKTKLICSLVVVALIAGLAAAQVPVKKMVRLHGWVVDEWCGKENAKADGKGCTLDCHKKGAALVFYDSESGEIYRLDKQDKAEEFVGREVGVFGILDPDGNLAVGQFVELKADGEQAKAKEG